LLGLDDLRDLFLALSGLLGSQFLGLLDSLFLLMKLLGGGF
jgi:hypothetical protein